MELPEAFIKRMQSQLGDTYTDFYNSLQTKPKVSIRINPQKISLPGISLNKVLWEPNAFYLNERPVFTLDPLFHAGAYYVQEASSMFTGYIFSQLFDQTKPLKILDLCGAPGGKTTHISSLMNTKSLLIANEVIKSRTHILVENVTKWGNPNVLVTQNDPKDFQTLKGFFDLILVDAPCSGEGLFRRDHAAIDEWSVENTQLCALRQQRIVADVWEALAPGGFLIYSTCTYNPNENEDNLNWMLEQFDAKNWEVNTPENWGISKISLKRGFGYQFLPYLAEGEGFFIAVVQKLNGEEQTPIKVKNQTNRPNKSIIEQIPHWFKNPDTLQIRLRDKTLVAIPGDMVDWIGFLEQKLKIFKCGTNVAELKGDKFIPHPDFAFSCLLSPDAFPKIDLNYYDTLLFLKKEPPKINSSVKGYYGISYKNVPLGWINHLGNRSNNLFPIEWRVRMTLPRKDEIQEPELWRNISLF